MFLSCERKCVGNKVKPLREGAMKENDVAGRYILN